MKTNIATDRSQSQRLLRCGVSADTADMVWTRFESDGEKYEQLGVMDESAYEVASLNPTPAWSLSRLLRLIPHVIEVYDDGDYYFSLAQEFPASEDYHAAYKYCWADDDVFVGKRSSCPIEACVQLVEWLKENNYKLNEQ